MSVKSSVTTIVLKSLEGAIYASKTRFVSVENQRVAIREKSHSVEKTQRGTETHRSLLYFASTKKFSSNAGFKPT